MAIILRVECYSGYKADERPLRFAFTRTSPDPKPTVPGNRAAVATETLYEVKEVLDRWYGPGYQCFKVRADDNNLYILRHDTEEDRWTLAAFRREQT